MNIFGFLKSKKKEETYKKDIKIPTTKFKHVYLVLGIKGGVGKSSISYAIATGLSKKSKTAIIDCDIESSNLKDFMDINSSNNMKPNQSFGVMSAIKINDNLYASGMSVFDSDYINKSIITTGSQLQQFINDFILYTYYGYGEIDNSIIDIPAGSSDILIAVLKSFERINQKIDGVIIVTQPNTITDFNRAMDLCIKKGLQVKFVVINMYKAISKNGYPVVCSKTNELFIPFNGKYDKLLSDIDSYNIASDKIFNIPLLEDVSIDKIETYLNLLINEIIKYSGDLHDVQ
jgi:Mrp family chromosome partitioning ATPase